MIVPTIGRIVWLNRPGKSTEAAIVCYVHGEGKTINVAGFSFEGIIFTEKNVTLIQEGEPKPDGVYACWMPYQQAAAKKYPVTGFNDKFTNDKPTAA